MTFKLQLPQFFKAVNCACFSDEPMLYCETLGFQNLGIHSKYTGEFETFLT